MLRLVLTDDTWHMTWQQQFGTGWIFYGLFPAFIIFAIWLVVKDVNRDRENEAETRMIRVQLWVLTKGLYRNSKQSTDHSDEDMKRARRERK